mmetsp:Transcript_33532/g.77336  ORF Transcript_33532/g.77336 Transcript_33532/m.77336 type:complete len:380 (-) Transcript_33532:212-1351(-)
MHAEIITEQKKSDIEDAYLQLNFVGSSGHSLYYKCDGDFQNASTSTIDTVQSSGPKSRTLRGHGHRNSDSVDDVSLNLDYPTINLGRYCCSKVACGWWLWSWIASLSAFFAFSATLGSVMRCDFVNILVPPQYPGDVAFLGTMGIFCPVTVQTVDDDLQQQQPQYLPWWLAKSPPHHRYSVYDIVDAGNSIPSSIARASGILSLACGAACLLLSWSLTLMMLPTSCFTTRRARYRTVASATATAAACAGTFGAGAYVLHWCEPCQGGEGKLEMGKCSFGLGSAVLGTGVVIWVTTAVVACYTKFQIVSPAMRNDSCSTSEALDLNTHRNSNFSSGGKSLELRQAKIHNTPETEMDDDDSLLMGNEVCRSDRTIRPSLDF